MKNPFRYGCVVEGEYFCPRLKLESEIRRFVESGQNIVVTGERRMGKTSLVKRAVLSVRGERMVYIDLYCIKTISQPDLFGETLNKTPKVLAVEPRKSAGRKALPVGCVYILSNPSFKSDWLKIGQTADSEPWARMKELIVEKRPGVFV